MLCHLSAFSGFLIPFGQLIGPLAIWLVKKEEMPFVDQQGKESLNFQITITIGFLICMPLIFIIIGFFLLWLLIIFDIAMIVIACIKSNEGIRYRYPISIRLLN